MFQHEYKPDPGSDPPGTPFAAIINVVLIYVVIGVLGFCMYKVIYG